MLRRVDTGRKLQKKEIAGKIINMESTEGEFSPDLVKNLMCCSCLSQFHVRDFNFLHNSKAPILLPCLHSMCASCYLPGKQIFCRLCQKTMVGDRYQQYNMYAMGHLAVAKSARRSVEKEKHKVTIEKPPKRCFECNCSAKLGCKQCENVFCFQCWDNVHSTAKILRSHQKVSLDDFSAVNVELCVLHNQLFSCFCHDCETAVCLNCLHENHRDHKTDLLSAYNKLLLPDIKSAAEAASKHLKHVENSLTLVRNELIQAASSAVPSLNKQAIVDYFQQLHGHLQKQEQIALRRLNECDNQKTVLANFESVLLNQIERIKKLLRESQSMFDPMKPKCDGLNGSRLLSGLKEAVAAPFHFKKNEEMSNINSTVKLKRNALENLKDLVTIENSENNPFELLPTDKLPEDYYAVSSTSEKLLKALTNLEIDVDDNSSISERSAESESVIAHSSGTGSDVDEASITLKSIIPVDVGYVVNPNQFYLYFFDDKNVFINLQKEVNKAAKMSMKPHTVYPGMRVFVTHSCEWFRGRVLNSSGNAVEVCLIDVGLCKTAWISDLRYQKDLMGRPLVKRCSLHNGSGPMLISPGTDETFKKLLNLSEVKITMKVINKMRHEYVGDLVVQFNDDFGCEKVNVRDFIMHTDMNSMKPFPNEVNVPNYVNQDLSVLNETTDVRITFISTPHLFFIRRIDTEADYLEMEAKMVKIYEKDDFRMSLFVRQRGSPCAYYCSDLERWQRGSIIFSQNKWLVHLVDVGLRFPFDVTKCRRLHRSLFNYPIFAFKVALANVESSDSEGWDSHTISKFKSFMVHPSLKCKMSHTEDSIIYVNLSLCDGTDVNYLCNKRFTGSKPLKLTQVVQPANPTVSSSCEETEESQQIFEIVVVDVVSPELIYFSSIDYKTKLAAISQELKECFISSLEEDEEWTVGQLVSFYSSESHQWRRGKILKEIDGDSNYEVFAYDVCRLECVHSKNLRQGSDKNFRIVLKARLVGIEPLNMEWNEVVIDDLKKLLHGAEKLHMVRKESFFKCDVIPVEIFVQETTFPSALGPPKVSHRSVGKTLCKRQLAKQCLRFKFSELKWNDHICTNSPFNLKIDEQGESSFEEKRCWLPALSLNERVIFGKVTFVDHRGVVYFYDVHSEYELHCKLKEELVDYSEPCAEETAWDLGESCIVRFYADNFWYRGRIVKVRLENELPYLVEFVDYGNIEACAVVDLRKAASHWDIPILCHSCYLADYELDKSKYGLEVVDRFHALLVDKDWMIEIIQNDREPYPARLKSWDGTLLGNVLGSHNILSPRTLDFVMLERDVCYDHTQVPPSASLSEQMENIQREIDNTPQFWNGERIITKFTSLRKINIILTGIIDDKLYARPAIKMNYPVELRTDIERYQAMHQEVNLAKLKSLSTIIGNVICFTVSNNTIMRAVLQKVGESTVKCFLIDHGGLMNFTMNELFICKKEWADIPAMAFRIELPDKRPGMSWPEFIVHGVQTGKAAVADILEVNDDHVVLRVRRKSMTKK